MLDDREIEAVVTKYGLELNPHPCKTCRHFITMEKDRHLCSMKRHLVNPDTRVIVLKGKGCWSAQP